MDDFLEFEGKTVEHAVDAACKHFNILKEELNYEIITRGSTGLFGLGSKKAKIKVFTPMSKQMDASAEMAADRSHEACTEAEAAIQSSQKSPKGSKNSNSQERPKRHAPKAQPLDTMTESSSQVTDAVNAVIAEQEEVSEITQPDETMLKEALLIAQQITGLAHFECEVSIQRQSEQTSLVFTGNDIPLVIGRDGQTLEAIEYIINRILTRKMGSIVPVTLDAGTYRANRDEKLISIAKHKAEAVKRTGKSMSLAPMNPRDRRLIHLSLRGVPGIRTASVGEGDRRRVVILPLNRSKRHARPATA
jgi:spoIIIJ-associated protein